MTEQNKDSPYQYDAPKRGKKMKATSIALLGVLAVGAIVGGSAWASANTSPDPSSATSQVANLTATAETDFTAPATDPTVSVPVVSYSDDDEADDQIERSDYQDNDHSINQTGDENDEED